MITGNSQRLFETRRLDSQARLAELVALARDRSPYYRDLYRDVGPDVQNVTELPVTDKQQLMHRFDDWCTDRAVTRDRVEAWVADRGRVGDRFLGRYLVATTSGTSGRRGLFVQDDSALRVNRDLSVRMMTKWVTLRDLPGLLRGGGRMAMVAATGGHFMVASGVARMQQSNPLVKKMIKVFSVHTPLGQLVTQLNAFRPAVLAGYGTLMSLLAGEQKAGRLRIRPMLIEPAGETLSPLQRQRIEGAFGAKIRDVYGSTECTFLTSGCAYGAYHLNEDWVIVEPVEVDHSPTPRGQLSHTVLITNLANRVQPVLRYDLGDRVRSLVDPCPCGNPATALQVTGRASAALRFPCSGGGVEIPALTFGTLLDHTPGVELAQIVQVGEVELSVRLRVAPGLDRALVWDRLREDLDQLLARFDLAHVRLRLFDDEPQQEPGGKFRTVISMDGLERVA